MRVILFELKNALFSKRFWGIVAAMLFFSMCSLANEMRAIPDSSVYYFYMVYFYYPMWLIILVLATIPGAISFCVEWKTKVYRLKVIRCGKKIYLLSKIAETWLIAFAATLFSQILLLGMLSIGRPAFLSGDGNALREGIYQAYLNENGIWVYFISKSFFLALGSGFFAILALWVSVKITDILVVVTMPMIGYYLIENLSVWLEIPSWLSVSRLIKGNVQVLGGVGYTWLYESCIFGAGVLIFSLLFFKSCRRRIENG